MKNILCLLIMLATSGVYAQTQDTPPKTPTTPSAKPSASRRNPVYTINLHTADNKTIPLKDSVSKSFMEKTEFKGLSVSNDKGEEISLGGLTYVFVPQQGDLTTTNMDDPKTNLIPALKNSLANAKIVDKIILDNIRVSIGGSIYKMEPMVLKIVP